MASPRPIVTVYYIKNNNRRARNRYVAYKTTHSASFIGAMRAAVEKISRGDYVMAIIDHPHELYHASIELVKTNNIEIKYQLP